MMDRVYMESAPEKQDSRYRRKRMVIKILAYNMK